MASCALYFVSPHVGKVPIPDASSLPFKVPRQTFLNFGPVQFNIEDIELSQALSVLEYDVEFNRVDPQPCHNMYQLADSFMKGVGFKLGKVDKFGA